MIRNEKISITTASHHTSRILSRNSNPIKACPMVSTSSTFWCSSNTIGAGSPTLIEDKDAKGALYVLMPMRV